MRRFTLKLGTLAAATLLALTVSPAGPAQATTPTTAPDPSVRGRHASTPAS